MKDSRRSFLKGIGVAGIAAGAGVATLSGSAAADPKMSSSFEAADPDVVTKDDGDLREVFVVPKVHTEWKGFDEAPTFVRYVLEAGIEGQGYKPVYRETPYLWSEENANGEPIPEYDTTDRFPDGGRLPLSTRNSAFYNVNANGDFVSPEDGSETVRPRTVLYKEGMEQYYDAAEDYPETAHWTGESLGEDGGTYANGNYGVIGDTSAFDAETDGESSETTVSLRLTTALLQRVEYEDKPTTTETLMQDEYPAYGSGQYTYQRLRDIAGENPCVSVDTASFTVTAENRVASSGTKGDAYPGAE